jgi:hypothetical protein
LIPRQLERITLHLASVSDSATTAGDSEFFPSIESSAGSTQTGLTVHRSLDRQKGTVRAQTILLRSHPSRQLVSAAPQIRSEARHPSHAVRMWRAQPVMELRRSSFPEASVSIPSSTPKDLHSSNDMRAHTPCVGTLLGTDFLSSCDSFEAPFNLEYACLFST